MIVLGLILVLLAAAAGTLLYLATRDLGAVPLAVAGFQGNARPLALLVSGAAVMLLLWLGLALIRASVRRKAKRRREAKETQRREETESRIRQEERARAAQPTPPVPAHRSDRSGPQAAGGAGAGAVPESRSARRHEDSAGRQDDTSPPLTDRTPGDAYGDRPTTDDPPAADDQPDTDDRRGDNPRGSDQRGDAQRGDDRRGDEQRGSDQLGDDGGGGDSRTGSSSDSPDSPADRRQPSEWTTADAGPGTSESRREQSSEEHGTGPRTIADRLMGRRGDRA